MEEFFNAMDGDGCNAVTREKANDFFKGAFGKISSDAMFNEVDTDNSGAITADEFVNFWLQVRSNGYTDEAIQEEIGELLEGGAWVDWKDNRDTTSSKVKFPKRPLFCKLSSKAWKKCEELFRKMDRADKMYISRHDAEGFYQGNFKKISADAMFNEVDVNCHGQITADEWMKFWTQVKGSGYKEQQIVEEIDQLLEGNPWVDWKDGRDTSGAKG
jgi:Ca2+-binding EF-hand superfamily protein